MLNCFPLLLICPALMFFERRISPMKRNRNRIALGLLGISLVISGTPIAQGPPEHNIDPHRQPIPTKRITPSGMLNAQTNGI